MEGSGRLVHRLRRTVRKPCARSSSSRTICFLRHDRPMEDFIWPRSVLHPRSALCPRLVLCPWSVLCSRLVLCPGSVLCPRLVLGNPEDKSHPQDSHSVASPSLMIAQLHRSMARNNCILIIVLLLLLLSTANNNNNMSSVDIWKVTKFWLDFWQHQTSMSDV